MRVIILIASVVALVTTASARSLEIHGVTGYLSEFELSATVSERVLNGTEELSGPLYVKHVGLCTHDGPNDTLGQLTLKFIGPAPSVTATLVFDGHECTYRGFLVETYNGTLNCADRVSLPLRLWSTIESASVGLYGGSVHRP
jgi:hypothetical protein